METIENSKELIVSLIKDNLINTKLVLGLSDLGLIADDYYLHLGSTVFNLMGFKASEQSDFIFENVFRTLSEKVTQINISSSQDELTLLSMEIYQELLFAKESFKSPE
jgi:hypothetical protein